MAVICAELVGARVRDAEEMHKLHDILLLPIALNRETEERDEKSKWSPEYLRGVNIYVVGTICEYREAW
jgi:hypothetical protein